MKNKKVLPDIPRVPSIPPQQPNENGLEMGESRLELINRLCIAVGIKFRARPDCDYLTKRELLHLLGWIKGAQR